jgi:iron complex transport system substrate-binding protein
MSRLDRARISYFEYAHAGLPGITQTIRAVGERVGRGPASSALADRIERELEEIRRSVAGRPRPKAVLLFGREPGSLRNVYASAGVGFMHDMLELAGGTDIFGDIKRQNVQATTEMLLARAPDVIIEVHPAAGWTPARIKTEMNAWRGLPGLPAVKSGRIHILADDRLMVPGPRIVEAAKLLRSFLHPG